MLPRAVRTRPKRPGELSKLLQHCLQRPQDSSKRAQAASKTPLIRLQDRSKSSQDASRTIPRALRLAKGIQVGSGSFQDASRSSPEEALEPPRRLQQLSIDGFGGIETPPRALQGYLPSLQLPSNRLKPHGHPVLSILSCYLVICGSLLFKFDDLSIFTFRLGTAECAERFELT